jgi:hypothetical protein
MNVGDKVVAAEGIVRGVNNTYRWANVEFPSGAVVTLDFGDFTATEPEYQVQTVYRDADNRLFYRRTVTSEHNPWRSCATGEVYSHDYPKRPLIPQGDRGPEKTLAQQLRETVAEGTER